MLVNGICWHRGTPPEYSETQQIMTTAPSHLIDSGRAVLEQLGGIALDFVELDPAAPAIAENTLANRSGIDPTRDLVSIPGVWLHLQLRLHAAREHLVSSLYLTGLAPGRAVVNPATTLARSAVEASAVILWLCSNTITWEERLRRGSQLHLTSAFNCLKAMGIDPRNPPDPSTVDQDIMISIAECNTLIDWVRAQGWTCRRGKQQGKAPTISTWVREVPAYSDLMDDASAVGALPPKMLRQLYATYSRSVHTDPVTVISGPSEAELARMASAHGAIATAVAIYGIAWMQFASWCSVPSPDGARENIIAVLRE